MVILKIIGVHSVPGGGDLEGGRRTDGERVKRHCRTPLKGGYLRWCDVDPKLLGVGANLKEVGVQGKLHGPTI